MPAQDAVVVITSETSDLQGELSLVWDYLLPAIGDKQLSAHDSLTSLLNQKLGKLALPLPVDSGRPGTTREISGLTCVMKPNVKAVQEFRLDFKDSICHLRLSIDGSLHEFNFGHSRWISGQTNWIGPDLFYGAKAHDTGLAPFKVEGSYCRKDTKTLVLVLRYMESPHTETITCRFKGRKVWMELLPSSNPGGGVLVVKGKWKGK